MIPNRDSIPTWQTPVVNYLLIAANVAVLVLMWLAGSQQEALVYQFALIPLGFFLRVTMVPAALVLGLWFVLQLFSGVLSLGGPDVGGVAFWAHIGGFVAGVVMALVLGKRRVDEYAPRW